MTKIMSSERGINREGVTEGEVVTYTSERINTDALAVSSVEVVRVAVSLDSGSSLWR